MNQGIWAVWYDLPEGARESYLSWAHSSYLPALQACPQVQWAAHYRYQGGGEQMARIKSEVVSHSEDDIGTGTQFLILVGASSPHAFFVPEFDTVAEHPDFADQLKNRQGVRVVVFTEEASVTGPANDPQDTLRRPAPAIQMGTLRPRSIEAEFDLIRWYAQYRLPSMAKMQGSLRTRKLSGIAGWAKHGILYEFESLAARLTHFEKGHESLALSTEHWTHRITRGTWHAPGSPFVGERIWPPVG